MAQSFVSPSVTKYDFPFDPVVNTPRKRKALASTDTWSSSQVKDDGFLVPYYGLIGLEMDLTWEIMAGTFYDALQRFYEGGGMVTWDAQERARVSGERYDVKIVNLDFENDNRLEDNDFVHGVKMRVNIRRAF